MTIKNISVKVWVKLYSLVVPISDILYFIFIFFVMLFKCFENVFWKVKTKHQFYQFYIYSHFYFIRCFRFWLFFCHQIMVFMDCFWLIPTILTKTHFIASKIVYSGNTPSLIEGDEIS